MTKSEEVRSLAAGIVTAETFQLSPDTDTIFRLIRGHLQRIVEQGLRDGGKPFPKERPAEFAAGLEQLLHDIILKYCRGNIKHGDRGDITERDIKAELRAEHLDTIVYNMAENWRPVVDPVADMVYPSSSN